MSDSGAFSVIRIYQAPAAVIAMVQKTRPMAMVDFTGKSIQLDAKTSSE